MSTVVTERTKSITGIASSASTDWGLLFLRLGLGVIFFAHGAQKVFGWWGGPVNGLEGSVAGMVGMGIPAPLAYLAVFTELFGGIALILGLFSRLAALGLAVTMVVAMAMVHLPNGFFLGAKPGIEYNLALFVMSLAVLFAGPGKFSLADTEASVLRRTGSE